MTDYNEWPKSRPVDDYWGQVRRTVNGVPVTEDQIELIVNAVCQGLDLQSQDHLLDLCCGNGALTSRLFARCAGGVGVDASEYLIGIAKDNFRRRASEDYEALEASGYVERESEPERFTKVLCYGSIAYLTDEDVASMLTGLRRRFVRAERMFIGNIPDAGRTSAFFGAGEPEPSGARDPSSAIGVWRAPDEMAAVAAEVGWKLSVRRMPPEFYSAHYRYDAVLVPCKPQCERVASGSNQTDLEQAPERRR